MHREEGVIDVHAAYFGGGLDGQVAVVSQFWLWVVEDGWRQEDFK